MDTNREKLLSELTAEKKAAIASWLNLANERCFDKVINPQILGSSLEQALLTNSPALVILTLCPAIKNTESPSSKGQTRELITIPNTNKRLRALFMEMLGVQLSLKRNLNIDTEILLIFADSLERGAEQMLTNAEDIVKISQESVANMRSVLFQIDQENPGKLQSEHIKIPKIRTQSSIETQGGKIETNRKRLIGRFENDIMNPNSKLFELWCKHLKLAKNDDKFTTTGWQALKSSESIWFRMRFLIAELIADGIFLPIIAKHIASHGQPVVPEPFFFASSVRPTTLQLEADCLNFVGERSIVPAFRNIGRWLEDPTESPWIEEFGTGIINSGG